MSTRGSNTSRSDTPAFINKASYRALLMYSSLSLRLTFSMLVKYSFQQIKSPIREWSTHLISTPKFPSKGHPGEYIVYRVYFCYNVKEGVGLQKGKDKSGVRIKRWWLRNRKKSKDFDHLVAVLELNTLTYGEYIQLQKQPSRGSTNLIFLGQILLFVPSFPMDSRVSPNV